MAAVAALLGELMMTGVKWPIFGFAAAWWTFVCAVYVDREAEIPQNDSDVH